MWNILRWIDKENFGSKREFIENYCETEVKFYRGHRVEKPVGSKNLDKLAAVIKPYTVSLKLNDLNLNLPPVQTQEYEIPMTAEQIEVYKMFDTADDIIVDDDHIVPNVLTKLIRLQQISTDPLLLGYSVGSGKLTWLSDWITDLDHQAIIFTRFRGTAQRIAHMHSAALLIGNSLTDGLTAFKNGDAKLLVGTIDAMDESLDLPMAHSAVFLDCTWSSLQMEQAQHRIVRAVDNPVPKHLIYLRSSSIDKLIADALKYKWTERQLVNQYCAVKMVTELTN